MAWTGNSSRMVSCVLGLSLVLACGRGAETVTVGDRTITVADVLEECGRFRREDPEVELRASARKALEHLVLRAVLLAPPLEPDEERRLRRQMENIAVEQCVAAELKTMLAERRDLEAEARARFAANPERYTLPESFRLQMIFLPANTPEGGQLARTLLGRIQRDPDQLAPLARQYSRSATAKTGGRTEPMPGSAVHPSMRAAINDHSGTDGPFLVELDRGWYLIKVLEFWPPPASDFETSSGSVMERVGLELVHELRAELAEQAQVEHRIEVAESLLAEPALEPSTVIYTVNDMPLTVGDLIPSRPGVGTVPSAIVRRSLDAYRRWREPGLVLGCASDRSTPVDENLIVGSRLPAALRLFTEQHLGKELADYVDLHRQVLVAEARFEFDLWWVPVAPGDPYRNHRRMVDFAAGSTTDEGISSRSALTVTASELDTIDPRLRTLFDGTALGEQSRVIRSSRLGLFLCMRPMSREPERLLDLADTDDRGIIASSYVSASREAVAEAFAAHHLRNSGDVDRLLEAVVSALEQRSEP